MIFVTKLRDMLESELDHYEFNTDIEEVSNDLEDDTRLNARGFQYISSINNNNENRTRLRSEVNLHNAMTMDRYPKRNYNFFFFYAFFNKRYMRQHYNRGM